VSDQAFDMAANRAMLNPDAEVPPRPHEVLAVEFHAVVHSKTTGKAGHRPGQIDFKLAQPSGLVENTVQQAESYRRPLQRIEGQRESGHHPGKHVGAERQPWPADELTGLLVHDNDIHLRVIDLNEVEGSFDLQPPRRRLHRLLRGFVLSGARPFNWIDVVNTTPDGPRIGRLFARLRQRAAT
jgi:hypothetical protein